MYRNHLPTLRICSATISKSRGIQKVFGASLPAIMFLFVKEFMLIIIPAAIIAIPAENLLMNK